MVVDVVAGIVAAKELGATRRLGASALPQGEAAVLGGRVGGGVRLRISSGGGV